MSNQAIQRVESKGVKSARCIKIACVIKNRVAQVAKGKIEIWG